MAENFVKRQEWGKSPWNNVSYKSANTRSILTLFYDLHGWNCSALRAIVSEASAELGQAMQSNLAVFMKNPSILAKKDSLVLEYGRVIKLRGGA